MRGDKQAGTGIDGIKTKRGTGVEAVSFFVLKYFHCATDTVWLIKINFISVKSFEAENSLMYVKR